MPCIDSKFVSFLQDYFISNYTASYIEDPGLSSDALWVSLIAHPDQHVVKPPPPPLPLFTMQQTKGEATQSVFEGQSQKLINSVLVAWSTLAIVIVKIEGSCSSWEALDSLVVDFLYTFVQVDPIFLPAADLLADNEDLLMALYETNATLINSLNTGKARSKGQLHMMFCEQRHCFGEKCYV